jgi:predicted AlkP superfamily phosphohydrolase/phosphomutase
VSSRLKTNPSNIEKELGNSLSHRKIEDPKSQADVARYILSRYEWNLFMTVFTNIDIVTHKHLYYTFSSLPGWTYKKGKEAWKMILEAYKDADAQVGKIISLLSDNDLIVVLSDHGNTATHTQVLINNLLAKEGLLKIHFTKKSTSNVWEWQSNGFQPYEVDLSKTKAFAASQWHIYINVKGRDPEGIVELGEEYHKIQERIIQLLYDLKNPETKEPCISIAVRADDAAGLGFYGPSGLYGDVVYATRPGYAFDQPVTKNLEIFRERPGIARHGMHHPTFKDLHAFCVMAGAGVKKDYIRERPIRLIDVAPTVAYIAEIPIPAQADGTILRDIVQKRGM